MVFLRELFSWINIKWKYLSSFLKKEWSLRDYPLQFRKRYNLTPDGKWTTSWTVQIQNWWIMAGSGDTMKEALEDLKCMFDSVTVRPPPGVPIPLEWAEMDEIAKYGELERDFIVHILGLEEGGCILTDMSSLWHYMWLDETVFDDIEERYGVDVSDIEDGTIVKIFARITEETGDRFR